MRENGREPKKPRDADRGDGCGDATTGVEPRSGCSPAASRPQDRDERCVTRHERADGVLGDRLPAPPAVGARRAGGDGQHAVEQHDALVAPRRQVAVRRGCDAEVVVQLAVDVRHAPRQRPHVRVDGERQSDRVAGRRIRILPDDEHAHIGERPLERPQHAVARGQVRAAFGDLGAQAVADLGDPRPHRGEGVRPALVDQSRVCELGEALRHVRRRPRRAPSPAPTTGSRSTARCPSTSSRGARSWSASCR